MRWHGSQIETVANGHLKLSWPRAGLLSFTLLCGWLRLRCGLRREGTIIVSPDLIILPDLVSQDLRLDVGWDIWDGYHLLSNDQAGDAFLRRLADRPDV
jgi:hypothetical protein